MRQEEIYEEWSRNSWLLDQVEKTPDLADRLVNLYDLLRLEIDYNEELEKEM